METWCLYFCNRMIAKKTYPIVKNKVLIRHNNTKVIVSQDLAIGRLISGSNPSTLFLSIHIGIMETWCLYFCKGVIMKKSERKNRLVKRMCTAYNIPSEAIVSVHYINDYMIRVTYMNDNIIDTLYYYCSPSYETLSTSDIRYYYDLPI